MQLNAIPIHRAMPCLWDMRTQYGDVVGLTLYISAILDRYQQEKEVRDDHVCTRQVGLCLWRRLEMDACTQLAAQRVCCRDVKTIQRRNIASGIRAYRAGVAWGRHLA